jgi:hypothetical protein
MFQVCTPTPPTVRMAIVTVKKMKNLENGTLNYGRAIMDICLE